jgi:hypothetical protein
VNSKCNIRTSFRNSSLISFWFLKIKWGPVATKDTPSLLHRVHPRENNLHNLLFFFDSNLQITDPADGGTRSHPNTSTSIFGRKTVTGLTRDLKWMKPIRVYVILASLYVGLLLLCHFPDTHTRAVLSLCLIMFKISERQPYGKATSRVQPDLRFHHVFKIESQFGEISLAD